MHVHRRRGWELPQAAVTPEAVALDRRQLLKSGLIAGSALAAGGLLATRARAEDVADPTADLYPAKRNEAFVPGRDVTPEEVNLTYNNFYEFGSDKGIYDRAKALVTRPWTVEIGGMVAKPMTLGIDDLIRKMPLEERVVRHRCVEAWSLVVPWTGFPLRNLIALVEPLGSAKYVRMETFLDKTMAPGQGLDFGYPWPYVEGLTIAEAQNELAFMVTGAYGKPLAKQFGAPIRLHTPWKYGFKSIKSIVRIELTDQRPKSFWEQLAPAEYGFWANVNPDVAHPRWSQAQERVLGAGSWLSPETVPTEIYNGYGEWVADLYKGLESERLFA